MTMVRVLLKKTVTDDGLCEMGEHVKVGDVYFVDLDSIRFCKWGHLDRDGE